MLSFYISKRPEQACSELPHGYRLVKLVVNSTPKCVVTAYFVAVKYRLPSGELLGSLFHFLIKPTQRQIRRAKKIAKTAFRDYLKQGGAAC